MTDQKADLVSLLVGAASLVSSLVILRKSRSEIEKNKEDTKKVSSDTRKVEVEVAEKFITSSGELIETYKTTLNSVMEQYANLEKRLSVLQAGLESEIAKRRNIERLTIEIYRGVKILLKQHEAQNTIPNWKPDKRLERELSSMEDSNAFRD